MEQMINGTKLEIKDLVELVGALYIENTTLRAKINLLMDQNKEKNNESKSK